MTVYVLDSSAVLRYIDDEPGSERVRLILRACVSEQARVWISAVQWGEIAGNLRKRLGPSHEQRILSGLLPVEAEIVPANGNRAVHSAELRVDRGLSYADAFALDLAMDSREHVLVTADYGFKSVADLVQIEFLPSK